MKGQHGPFSKMGLPSEKKKKKKIPRVVQRFERVVFHNKKDMPIDVNMCT